MKMAYLEGLTFEEACGYFALICGHVNDGLYSGPRTYFFDDPCGGDGPSDYDTQCGKWLSVYDMEE